MKLPGNPESRPLSPHLQVYRPMYTMVLSILHRASGMFLSVGSVVLVVWLACIAAGASVYQAAGACLSSLPARIVIAGVLAAFWYHLFAGLRHLSWDTGFGFGRRGARVGGALIVLLAALAFLATLFWTPAGRWLGVIA